MTTTQSTKADELDRRGQLLSLARTAVAAALNDALDAAVEAVEAGEVSERAAAAKLGVDRGTIRKHSGKGRRDRYGAPVDEPTI